METRLNCRDVTQNGALVSAFIDDSLWKSPIGVWERAEAATFWIEQNDRKVEHLLSVWRMTQDSEHKDLENENPEE